MLLRLPATLHNDVDQHSQPAVAKPSMQVQTRSDESGGSEDEDSAPETPTIRQYAAAAAAAAGLPISRQLSGPGRPPDALAMPDTPTSQSNDPTAAVEQPSSRQQPVHSGPLPALAPPDTPSTQQGATAGAAVAAVSRQPSARSRLPVDQAPVEAAPADAPAGLALVDEVSEETHEEDADGSDAERRRGTATPMSGAWAHLHAIIIFGSKTYTSSYSSYTIHFQFKKVEPR